MADQEELRQGLSAQVESGARALVQIIARDLTPGPGRST